MELANDFMISMNILLIYISTASTPSSIYSRVHNHDRHDGNNSFTFTETCVDRDVDKLKAISNSKASGLDRLSTKLIKYGTET